MAPIVKKYVFTKNGAPYGYANFVGDIASIADADAKKLMTAGVIMPADDEQVAAYETKMQKIDEDRSVRNGTAWTDDETDNGDLLTRIEQLEKLLASMTKTGKNQTAATLATA